MNINNDNEIDFISTKGIKTNLPPVEKLIFEKKENKQHFNRLSFIRNRISFKAEEKKKEDLDIQVNQKTSLKNIVSEPLPFKLKVLNNKYSNLNPININGSSSNASSNSRKSKIESQNNTNSNATHKSDSIFSNSNKSNSGGNIQNTSSSIIKTQIQASNDSNSVEHINEKIININIKNTNFNLNEVSNSNNNNIESVINIQDSSNSLFKTIIEKPQIDPFLHVLPENNISFLATE